MALKSPFDHIAEKINIAGLRRRAKADPAPERPAQSRQPVDLHPERDA